ncbi:hypothetical protein [Paenibacillus azoreducens]|uniref:Tail tape measure protein n=1 Tax=Paenibacillus azoreducens TaxID=116718 RepID=A0A920CRM1_9BACL|nr:hypothetical protein [Paenibacillus azoreducens]GIO47274.1 hypothetical protein J34TS1_20390 [Paenibacillus azoreducens]
MAQAMNCRMNLVIEPKNVIKANRELRAMERYFERIQGRVLRIGRTRMAPEIVLKDYASKGLDQILHKINRVKSQVIHASGTVKLKVVQTPGILKVEGKSNQANQAAPNFSALVSSLTANTVVMNKMTAVIGGGKSGGGPKEDPASFLDNLKAIFSDLKTLGGGLKSAGEIPEKLKGLKDVWNNVEKEAGPQICQCQCIGNGNYGGNKGRKGKKGSKNKKPKRSKANKQTKPKKVGSKLLNSVKKTGGGLFNKAKGLMGRGKDMFKNSAFANKASSLISTTFGKIKNSSLVTKTGDVLKGTGNVFKGGAGKLFGALGFGKSKNPESKPGKLSAVASKVGEWAKKGAKSLGPVGESLAAKTKGIWGKGKDLLKGGGSAVSKAFSFAGSAAVKVGKGGLGVAGKILKGGANAIFSPFSSDGKAKGGAAKPNKIAKAGSKLFKLAGKSGELLQTVGSAGVDIIGGAQDLWKHGKELLGGKTGIASKAASLAGSAIDNVGKSGLGSLAGGIMKGGMKKLLGPLSLVADAASIATAEPGKERAKAIGSAAGGTIGSVIGGAVGSLIPIPGVGTILGTTVGGALGDFVGGKIGGFVSDIAPKAKEAFSSVTGWVSGLFGKKKKPKEDIAEKPAAIPGPSIPPKQSVPSVMYGAALSASVGTLPMAGANVPGPSPRMQSAVSSNAAAATSKVPQVVQISPEQMSELSGFLRDFKTETTNQFNLPAGAVQVTVHEEYPVDVEGIIQQVGQRLRAEFAKATQNRKPQSMALA